MKYLQYLVEEIHSTVLATVDSDGRPVTCAVDMMDFDEMGLYFLTAKGKRFYDRLKANPYIALTGMKGEDTLSCAAVSIQGRAEEIGAAYLPRLLAKNPYMAEIYPDEAARRALTVFRIGEGTGEWFDLSRKPIERASFAFGGARAREGGYFVTARCTGCGACAAVCPQGCIDTAAAPAQIRQENCLHCGNCLAACPAGAIERR